MLRNKMQKSINAEKNGENFKFIFQYDCIKKYYLWYRYNEM